MSGLVEFLRARYTEAREQQLRIFRSTWDFGAACPVCGQPTEAMRIYGGSFGPLASFEPCRHEIHDPAVLRQFEEPAPDPDVIADLDAKLAILDEHWVTRDVITVKPDGMHGFGCATCHQDEGMTIGDGWCRTLRLLAVPLAGHPDYREEWRP